MQIGAQTKPKYPVNRNSIFFSERDFAFEEELGEDYILEDVGQSVVLYRVDLERTNLNQTYYESHDGGVVFKTPIEVPCIYKVEQSELRSYEKGKSLASYLQNGSLTLTVYEKTLKDLRVDIHKGDYIGVIVSESKLQLFTVVNDGKANNDNRHTMYGSRPFYRSIECAEVNINEFDGR